MAGYQQVIARLHLRGIKVIGGTLKAFGGSERFDARSEASHQTINAFIRDSEEFDGVADFDLATRDPDQPEVMKADFSGDDRLPKEFRLCGDGRRGGPAYIHSVGHCMSKLRENSP